MSGVEHHAAASAPPDLDAVTAALVRRVRPLHARAGATRVIAIDGPSGGGKTTLGHALAEALGGAVLQMESIYPGWDGLDEASRRLVRDVLQPLALGRPASIHRWDWQQSREAEWEPVPPTHDLIVEGVGAAPWAAWPYLSLVVWVDAPENERRRRAIARDGDVFAPHWDRWAAQERVAFAREGTRDRADLIIRSHVDGVPAWVIERGAEPLL